MKKVIILGTGLSGLASALLLAKKGHNVTIYEQQAKPGGKVQAIIKDEFMFDISPYNLSQTEILNDFLTMHEPRALTALNWTNIEHYTNFFGEGDHIRIFEDPAKTAEEFDILQDKAGFNYLRFYHQGRKRKLLGLLGPKDIQKYLAKKFTDKDLIHTLTFSGIFWGFDQDPHWFAERHHNSTLIKYPKGGPKRIIDLFAELCNENNVEIKLGTKVDELVCESDKVVGVRIQDEKIRADAVISTLDDSHLYMDLVPRRLQKNKIIAQIINSRKTLSQFLVCLAVNNQFNLPYQTNYFSYDMDRFYSDVFKNHEIPKDPSFTVFSMKAVNELAAPAGKDALVIRVPVSPKDGTDWDREKARYAQFMICALEDRGLAGLKHAVEKILVMSPVEYEQKFGTRSIFDYENASFKLRQLYRIEKERDPSLFSCLPAVEKLVKKISTDLE